MLLRSRFRRVKWAVRQPAEIARVDESAGRFRKGCDLCEECGSYEYVMRAMPHKTSASAGRLRLASVLQAAS